MTSLRQVTPAEFSAALDEGQVRILQMLQGAIGFGVFLFVVVVGYMAFGRGEIPGTPASGDSIFLIQIMTITHLVLAVGAYVGAGYIFNLQFSDANLEAAMTRTYRDARGVEITSAAGRCISVIRTAMITRLAILEAPALFGLVVCLLGVFDGVLMQEPIYWINALSAIGLIAFVIRTFPNRTSLEALYREKIAAAGSIS